MSKKCKKAAVGLSFSGALCVFRSIATQGFSHNHPLRLPVSLDIWQRYIYFLILTPLRSILYADLTTLSSMASAIVGFLASISYQLTISH